MDALIAAIAVWAAGALLLAGLTALMLVVRLVFYLARRRRRRLSPGRRYLYSRIWRP